MQLDNYVRMPPDEDRGPTEIPARGRPRREVRRSEELGRAVVGVLAKARRDAGLTRPELAARSGVSANTIMKIERGATTDPGVTIVVRLTHTLGIGLDSLINQARDIARSSEFEDHAWPSGGRLT